MSDKLRVGIIGRTGRGNYGHGLDTVWLEVPEAEIVGVADDDKAGLAAAVKRLGGPPGFADYRRMLDEARPDVVSICPRWIDRHHEMALACAQRRIHMYLEKPFCRTLSEADEIVAACERSHVKLAIAHQTRYSPMIPVVRQLIHEGRLGRLLELRGRGKEDRRGGGEDLWVLGTHILDLMALFAGNAQWCFASVLQDGRPIASGDVVQGNEGIGPLAGDSISAVYGMADGVRAYFSTRRNAAGRLSRYGMQIFGTEGILEVATGYLPAVKYLPDPSWSPGRSGAAWQDVSTAGIAQPEPLSDKGLPGANLRAVLDLLAAIREDRQPQASVYTARAATEMIVAVFASRLAGGPVDLPLTQRGNPLSRLV